MKKLYLFLSLSLSLVSITTLIRAQNLVVTPNQTPQQLVNALVGAGVNPTNISGQLTPLSNGLFTNNGVTGFSLTSGIILSSGDISGLPGTAAGFNSADLGIAGDVDLDAIVTPLLTQDASIIDFDFTAANDSVEFYFVFGSEEYNEYANTSFNDVFAFIINGPGYAPNTNIALLPGTIVPISINTVNNGNSSTTAAGPCMNCAYYLDNVGTNAVGMSLDGYTIAIHIKFPIWPCSGYHFKLAVADVADGVFDSAVMLQENSFAACPNMQATQHAMPVNDTLTICVGGSATLTAPEGASYSWNTGETTRSILVTQPGTYSFTILDPQQSSCFAFSDNITVNQQGAIQTPAIVQNGNSLFAPNLIPSPAITYQWSLDGAPINGATQSTLIIPGNGCYTLTVFEGNCESTSNIVCITNTSIYEIAESGLHIFPNPATTTCTIETPFEATSTTTLQLFDIAGREAHTATQQQGTSFIIRRGNLPSGVYFLKISNSDYQGVITKKIVLQ